MYLSEFKLIIVGLVMHGALFKDIDAVKLALLAIITIDPIKRNNAINTFLINPDIIFYYF